MTGKSGRGKKGKKYEVAAVYDDSGKTFQQLMEEAFKQIISNGRQLSKVTGYCQETWVVR